MMHKGDLLDQFTGVPKDPAAISEFFTKAKELSPG